MGPRTISKSIADDKRVTDRQEITAFIEWLKEMQAQGATHIDFEGFTDQYGSVDEICVSATEMRLETPEEVNERVKIAEKIKKMPPVAEITVIKF